MWFEQISQRCYFLSISAGEIVFLKGVATLAEDSGRTFMAQLPLKIPPGSMEITGAWMSPPSRPGGYTSIRSLASIVPLTSPMTIATPTKISYNHQSEERECVKVVFLYLSHSQEQNCEDREHELGER